MYALRRTATLAGKRRGPGRIPVLLLSGPVAKEIGPTLRRIHTLRPLPYDIDEGLGNFLSPEALKTVAHEYQLGLLERLNEEVAGTELEPLSVAQTVVSASNSAEHILAWNYASQALNNSFFFDNLLPLSRSPPPLSTSSSALPLSHEHTISSRLLSLINESFGSISDLKSSLSAAAQGLMGSGWIWLVCDENAQHLGFVATYGPGTLLVRNRQHRHPEGLDGVTAIGGKQVPGTMTGKILGERMGSPDVINPLARRPNTGGLRSFHQSSGVLSPLPAALLQGLNAKPRFSQTQSWAPLEPLSKTPYSPVKLYSTRPTDEADELGAALEPEPKKESETTWEENESGADALLSPLTKRSAGLLGSMSERATIAWDKNRLRGTGDDLSPLLCISVHEHMWLTGGYGIWGKEEYLKRYWSVVDWAKVSRILELWTPNSVRAERDRLAGGGSGIGGRGI